MHAERFESAWWQTSSLLLVADREALVVDPCISRQEVERIAARAGELGARVTSVLATHADWDHVCGIAAFPEAEAAMGERTAELVSSGEPARRAEAFAAEHGVELPGPPRADRRLAVGSAHHVGPFVVETLPLAGHTPDGTAYRVRALDLLAVGDHLSIVEFPFASSTAAYRSTLATLIELLRHDPPGRVVCGHGPEGPGAWSAGTGPSTPRRRRSPSRRRTSPTYGVSTPRSPRHSRAGPIPSTHVRQASPSSRRVRQGTRPCARPTSRRSSPSSLRPPRARRRRAVSGRTASASRDRS